MKRLLFLSLITSCVSMTSNLKKETSFSSPQSLKYWVEYGHKAMTLKPKELGTERDLTKKYQELNAWQTRLKHAILIGLRPRNPGDYERSLALLKDLKDEETALPEDVKLALSWYILQISDRSRLYGYGMGEHQAKLELEKKLKALSEIEQRLQQRVAPGR